MAEIRKGACTGCDRADVSITATDVLRVHAANGKRTSADNPPCPGSGQSPKGGQGPEPGVQGYVCRIPAGDGCGLQVARTSNGRARSHLMADMRTPCPGGSDWPYRVDPAGNRHDTAPGSEPGPAVGPEELLMDDDVSPTQTAGEFDPAVPGGAFVSELKTAVGDPGTVARQLEAYRTVLGFDPQDPEGPGEEPSGCTHPDGFQDTADVPDKNQVVDSRRARMDAVAAQAEVQVFDVTHRYHDGEGGVWQHPGELLNCRLPECCTHPRGFGWSDDGKGHSGVFCLLCGSPEPEPDINPNLWTTPANLLAEMPEGVRRTAESNPECWDCGHEITPRASRFSADSRVTHVVWECSAGSRTCHPERDAETGWCRPQLPQEAHLADLDAGECFMRHTAKPPLDRLVYRAGTPSMGPLTVTVVGSGPYAGRTGSLTNLQEEITRTDQHGTPRPRRTPSPPARPTPSPDPGPARSSTPPTTPSATPPSASKAVTSGRANSSGRSATAGTPTPSASKRTAVPDAFSTPKQALNESDKYDRFGRYKLLHPDTGKPVKWTRATTFAKSVQDTFALSMWGDRMVLKGCALRPDIPAAAGTLDVKADKNRMNELAEEAKKAAGNKIAANKGTAVHAFTEDRDKALVGEQYQDRPVPEEFVPTVEAYEAILRAFGLEPVPGLIEFTTAVKQFEIAGTSDRVYRVTRDITFTLNKRTITLYAGEYVVGDVKTGADLSYGWQEICIQLALYVQGLNTSGVWDWGTGRWAKPNVPGKPDVLLKVRTDVGLIPHLPVDRKPDTPLATLYAIDLDAGWAACVLCEQVRAWRKTGGLATALEIADVAEGGPDTGSPVGVVQHPVSSPVVSSRPVSLEDRAKAVTTRAEASALFQEAKAARVPVARLKALTETMTKKLEAFVEQGA